MKGFLICSSSHRNAGWGWVFSTVLGSVIRGTSLHMLLSCKPERNSTKHCLGLVGIDWNCLREPAAQHLETPRPMGRCSPFCQGEEASLRCSPYASRNGDPASSWPIVRATLSELLGPLSDHSVHCIRTVYKVYIKMLIEGILLWQDAIM